MTVIEHWVCENCDSVDGPTVGEPVDGGLCRVCKDEGEHGVIVGLVPLQQLRGAVEALAEWLDASDGLKAVDTSDGKAIRAALGRVDAAKATARALVGGR